MDQIVFPDSGPDSGGFEDLVYHSVYHSPFFSFYYNLDLRAIKEYLIFPFEIS